MLVRVLHGDEAVHDVAQVGEIVQGHLHGDPAFGGYDGHLYAGGAEPRECLCDVWKLLDQGVVVLLVVVAVGFQQELGLFGVHKLHLAWKGLADVGEEGLAGDVVTAQDRARGVAHALIDHLGGVDEGPVEVEEGRLQQSLVEPVP